MEQIKHVAAAEDCGKRYSSPEVKVVFVRAQGILCQSGNGPMYEKDYGDGGFHD